jgi:predicted DNA-binding transcriptional regulator YafY
LDRVLQAELRDEEFVRPPNFDSLGYLTRTIANMPGTWPVEVLLETTLEEAQRRVPATIATLEEVPEGIIMRCYAQSLEWMAHFLVGLHCPLIVREPLELREALREVAREIAQLAERGDPSLRSG